MPRALPDSQQHLSVFFCPVLAGGHEEEEGPEGQLPEAGPRGLPTAAAQAAAAEEGAGTGAVS